MKVEDCADVEDNVIVICYQFVLDISADFASAVGFFTVSIFYVNIYGSVLILLMKLTFSPRIAHEAKVCSLCMWLGDSDCSSLASLSEQSNRFFHRSLPF